MILVSQILKRVVYPVLSSTGYLRKRAANGALCVVTYHGVRPPGYISEDPMLDAGLVAADTLRAHLRVLKQRYQIIDPELFLDWLRGTQTLPPRALLLTCDDGLRNVRTCMVPVLREAGVRCLFFVTGASTSEAPTMLWYDELYLLLKSAPRGEIPISTEGFQTTVAGQPNLRAAWWRLVQTLSEHGPETWSRVLASLRGAYGDVFERIRRDPPCAERHLLLTASELKQVQSAGMTIGAHTLDHPMLSRMNEVDARKQIVQSREALERTVGHGIWALAYPFGTRDSFGEREAKMAEEAGFSCAFANYGGGFGAGLPRSRFALPRVHVAADMTPAELEAHVSGLYRRLRDSADSSSGGGG